MLEAPGGQNSLPRDRSSLLSPICTQYITSEQMIVVFGERVLALIDDLWHNAIRYKNHCYSQERANANSG